MEEDEKWARELRRKEELLTGLREEEVPKYRDER